MAYWLCSSRGGQETGVVKRFDPRFWTVDFPRPMMASVVTTAADALRVEAVFYRSDDLAGLIWEAQDRWDHPLLAYETSRDFRECRLRFRWRSAGIMPLDAVNGPTLTIEGRDAAGAPRTWYVRLWNYASGSPEDAAIDIDFGALDGGFLLPGEADPVWAGDVDRMFLSLVPPGYSGVAGALPQAAEAWVELSMISCDGAGSVLTIGDVVVPEHALSIASGYDDSYNLTPARLLRNMMQLGYRGQINHYVGMSHYFRLDPALDVTLEGGALNAPCIAWHRDFSARAAALGHELIWSLSYELFDAHCPEAWKQRAANGDPALTGWVPPSTLLSPANGSAMAYLQAVARAFIAIALETGQAPKFQVGEPWWWVMPDRRICLYDDAARAAFGGNPPVIDDVTQPMDAVRRALLDQAGAMLAASTAALIAAVKTEAPAAETLLLVYLPSVLADDAPEVRRANVPPGWARPAFDVLQLEDYDWVTQRRRAERARAIAEAETRLGYGPERQHYLSGFVLRPENAADWAAIEEAAGEAGARGVAATFIWAMPQVARDGYVHFEVGDSAMQPFDDVAFPLALGREAAVAPEFSTAIVTSASGHETRNADWAEARLRFDAGPGVRSQADIEALIGFFRARMGPARSFRFADPFDHSSNGGSDVPAASDQLIGTGDGTTREFALVKHYGGGARPRRITLPVAGSVRVAIDGIETAAFTMLPGGVVALDTAPAIGVPVTAGYRFDVRVRFAEDRLEVNRASVAAGEAPSVPLIEVRERV